MFTKATTALVAAGLLLSGEAAVAGDDYGRKHRARYAAYENGYDYAQVIDVDPIVREVRITAPRRECWVETRYERVPRYEPQHVSVPQRGAAGSMILGSILGAAVGNQFGRGDGRRAATVAGAIIGSALGHDHAARRAAGPHYANVGYEERPYDVERCDVRYDTEYEQRIDGYRVTYLYNGREHVTRLPYDPGDRIRVRVDVRPAERY